jgi:hypothetical protein
MKVALTMCMAAGMACGAANGQINVISTTGLARATAGDGSGSSQQTSANLTSFNLNATKNFSNGGHVDANNTYSLSGNVMQGSFASSSFAASQFEAGWAETYTVINFNLQEDMDIEYQGGGLVEMQGSFASRTT